MTRTRRLIVLLALAAIALAPAATRRGIAAENEESAGKPDDARSRKHWAFQPPVRPPVPDVPAPGFEIRNPIDAFVAREHVRLGLRPAAPADRRTLLRRLWLDLVGLPPDPASIRRFLDDRSPAAVELALDELLASPWHGERWARHWMDVWRYSDWYGYGKEIRNSQPHIWRWRDWIIESLNEDRPYDRMVVEMLAADEAAPTDPRALRATGFLARNYYKFNRNTWLDDTVEHTAKAFLAVTMNCARCHEHMYDPIPQRDYYRFRAFFEPHRVRLDRLEGEPDTAKAGLVRAYDADLDTPTFLFVRGNDKLPEKDTPIAPGLPEVLAPGGIEIEPVELPPEAHTPSLRDFVQAEEIAAAQGAVTRAGAELEAARAAVIAGSDGAADGLVVAELALETSTRALSAVRARIAADNARHGRAVTGAADGETDAKTGADALALEASRAERWLTVARAEEAVARARVEVGKHEGGDEKKLEAARKQLDGAEKQLATARKALGEVSSEYTPLGPSHPRTSSGRRLALARWIVDRRNPLAARVAVNHIWSRHFGSPLVPTLFDFGLNGREPEHADLLDWLAVELMESGWSMKAIHRLIVASSAWRMSSSAHGLDDNLAVDPDNRFLWRMNARRMEAEVVRDSVLAVAGRLDSTMGGPELDAAKGMTTTRRSIYYRHAHEKYMRFLQVFDGPSVFECYDRDETVVPQQALALVNSALAREQSRRLAASLAAGAGDDATAFVRSAFERVLGRPPAEEELVECMRFLEEQERLLASRDGLAAFASGPDVAVSAADEPARRARESLVHVLINHNDFVTIR